MLASDCRSGFCQSPVSQFAFLQTTRESTNYYVRWTDRTTGLPPAAKAINPKGRICLGIQRVSFGGFA